MKALVLSFFLALVGSILSKDVVHFQLKTKNGKNIEADKVKEMLLNLKSALDDILSKDLEFDANSETPLTLHISRMLGYRNFDDYPKDQLARLFVRVLNLKNVKVEDNSEANEDVEDVEVDDNNGLNLYKIKNLLTKKRNGNLLVSRLGLIKISVHHPDGVELSGNRNLGHLHITYIPRTRVVDNRDNSPAKGDLQKMKRKNRVIRIK